jgi:long-subunit acyl-CoA synthetase (AMP-forming)
MINFSQPFVVSPRNSVPAIMSLLRKTDCSTVVTGGANVTPLIDTLKADYFAETNNKLNIVQMPSLAQLYPKLCASTAEDIAEPYPTPTTRPKLEEPALLVHSSGSSGVPRHVILTHRVLEMYRHTRK